MSEIKIGDVVALKSGGLQMTVASVKADDLLYCIWFDASDSVRDGSFPRDTLILMVKPVPK